MSNTRIASLLEAAYKKACAEKGSKVYNLTRGRPSIEQLNLMKGMDGCLKGDYCDPRGRDSRVYGQDRLGLAEMRELFAHVLDASPERTMVHGNSSLQLIYFAILFALMHGTHSGGRPWSKDPKVQFLCPEPGYDRHFKICSQLGIEMLPVPMNEYGPDMDVVEDSINSGYVKGMFCVPRFSNPTGVTYTDEVVRRIARLGEESHPDFRVFWDNAYAVHELQPNAPKLLSIMKASEEYGTENSILQFFSTSKVSLSGAGIAGMASSETNISRMAHLLSTTTIGCDRVNQLRHIRTIANLKGLRKHMAQHVKILKPKFEMVDEVLKEELPADGSSGRWNKPKGGYFILFEAPEKCATDIWQACAEMGLKLNRPGSMHTNGRDPHDSLLRIAPTALTLEDLEKAMRIFAMAVKVICARRENIREGNSG
jgi:DNA-binding transcriptional MocR family regulator